MLRILSRVPSLSHLRLVVLGESAGLSKNFVLMMHPSCDSGPPLLPKLTWFHYEGPIESCGHVVGEMVSTTSQKPQGYPNHDCYPQLVSHARYDSESELTDDVECKMRWLTKAGMDQSIRSFL
jgi:hypothetical protein